MNLDVGSFNITSDRHNVIVNERYRKEDGSEGFRFVGYYRSIQVALKALFDVVARQSDAQTINKLLDDIDRYKKDIEQLIERMDFNSYQNDSQKSNQTDIQEDLSFLD